MLYNPPTGSTDPNAPYVGKNVAAGQQGSKVPPSAVEFTQREIVAPIAESGQSPTNADPKQLLRAIRGGALTTFTDQSTAANTVVLSPGTAHNDLHKGLPFRIFPAFTNTSATVTVQVNTLTTSLRRRDGTQPAPGDIVAGVPIDVVSDGTNFRILGFTPSDIANLVASASTAAGYVQIGDQSYGASAADRVVATSAAFTVPRSITLPSAGARLAGDTLVFMDRFGAVSAFNPLTFAATGTDTLDGAPSFTIGAPYQVVTFRSDGSGRWTYDRKASTAFRPAGDADVTVLASDGTVSTSVPLTASRTWTLPSANAVKAGTPIILTDIFGACGPGTTVTLAGKGTDTLNGQASIALSTAFFQAMAISDGISRWAIQVVDPKQFTTVHRLAGRRRRHRLGAGPEPSPDPAEERRHDLRRRGAAARPERRPHAGQRLQRGGGAGPHEVLPLPRRDLRDAHVRAVDHEPRDRRRRPRGEDRRCGRRLVGMAYTNASGQFQNSAGFFGLINYFNRRGAVFDSGSLPATTISGSTPVPLGNSITFLAWADDIVKLRTSAMYTSGQYIPTLYNYVDGASVGVAANLLLGRPAAPSSRPGPSSKEVSPRASTPSSPTPPTSRATARRSPAASSSTSGLDPWQTVSDPHFAANWPQSASATA